MSIPVVGRFALPIVLLLAGCIEAAPISSEPAKTVPSGIAVSVFQRTCLDRYTGGAGVQIQTAMDAGLVNIGPSGPFTYAFQLPGSRLEVGNIEHGGMRTCTMYADTTDDPVRLRQALLSAARKAGGDQREQVLNSSRFQTAIRLPNGRIFLFSVFDQEKGVKQTVTSLTAVVAVEKIPDVIGQ